MYITGRQGGHLSGVAVSRAEQWVSHSNLLHFSSLFCVVCYSNQHLKVNNTGKDEQHFNGEDPGNLEDSAHRGPPVVDRKLKGVPPVEGGPSKSSAKKEREISIKRKLETNSGGDSQDVFARPSLTPRELDTILMPPPSLPGGLLKSKPTVGFQVATFNPSPLLSLGSKVAAVSTSRNTATNDAILVNPVQQASVANRSAVSEPASVARTAMTTGAKTPSVVTDEAMPGTDVVVDTKSQSGADKAVSLVSYTFEDSDSDADV